MLRGDLIMMSITSATVNILEQTWLVIRHIAFSDMDQMARGWGLNAASPSPRSKRQPAIDLHFSTQSRRTLVKHAKRVATVAH